MVAFRLPGRQVRLKLETHLARIEVVSILPQPYAGEPFPGHDQINHRYAELDAVGRAAASPASMVPCNT